MNHQAELIGSFDATMVFLWVAGGIAAIFILVILFDTFRPSRRRLRRLSRQSQTATETDTLFGRIRVLSQALESEAAKRRRKSTRQRDKEL